ncbi:MAG: sugar transferase [Chitinimonas sp.]|nr:sugar transferase [Chitinimonas sp.]
MSPLLSRFNSGTKRLLDILLGLLALLLCAPVLLLLYGLLCLQGGRPLFGHVRVGRHGRTFHCYKFRTMYVDAEQRLADLLARDPEARRQWQQDFKLKQDPRVTPLGAFLRKSSLDELPQLWNVLRGQMSLVGPRPVVSEELPRYGEALASYLAVRPGITGLWQVSGRNDTSYAQRVALDAHYVRNWSLWLDISILLRTCLVVLNRRGAY